jgi:hypothetical protein
LRRLVFSPSALSLQSDGGPYILGHVGGLTMLPGPFALGNKCKKNPQPKSILHRSSHIRYQRVRSLIISSRSANGSLEFFVAKSCHKVQIYALGQPHPLSRLPTLLGEK